jgi:membrane protein implicated in regulation of membrane protease activity
MMHNQDRELQIRLAELQADIQINLTICFGFFAGFIGIAVAVMQIIYSLSSEQIALKIMLAIFTVVAIIFCWYYTYFFAKRVETARDKLKDLQKQYVW